MVDQIPYYNQFGLQYRYEIINSADPSVWASDIKNAGPISRQMKERIERQREYILKYFFPAKPILDIGCGFGRQSFLLAKEGFKITGIDSSPVFIEIAKSIFEKHKLTGEFFCCSAFDFASDKSFEQILLLDVIEHISPEDRIVLLQQIIKSFGSPKTRILVTFPAIDNSSLVHNLKNFLKETINKIRASHTEHPYHIPTKVEFENSCKGLFSIRDYSVQSGTAFWVLEAIS